MKTFLIWLPVICLVFATGCGLEGPIPSKPKSDAPASNTAPEPNAAAASSGDKKAPDKVAGKAPGAVKLTGEQKPGTVREKAAVGMGEKGRGYGGGIVTMPLRTIWNAREMLVLDQIKEAMKLYKASEGHAPKTKEEFMDKIIKANNLKLPTLPEGHSYVYDPNTEELLVERPNNL